MHTSTTKQGSQRHADVFLFALTFSEPTKETTIVQRTKTVPLHLVYSFVPHARVGVVLCRSISIHRGGGRDTILVRPRSRRLRRAYLHLSPGNTTTTHKQTLCTRQWRSKGATRQRCKVISILVCRWHKKHVRNFACFGGGKSTHPSVATAFIRVSHERTHVQPTGLLDGDKQK